MADAPGPGICLGGAAAMAITPLPPLPLVDEALLPKWLLGVLPAVLAPERPPLGLSPSPARCEGGVAAVEAFAWPLLFPFVVDVLLFAGVESDSVEFLREAAVEAPFLDLVLVPPMGRFVPDPRFLFLMTSVFKLSGRTTPCSFRNKPHALHNGCPSGLRRHSGVVCVKQLVQVVGPFPSP
jgi:hypothetical protein